MNNLTVVMYHYVRNLKNLENFVTPESEGKGKAKESVDKYKETVEENE